VFYKYSNIGNLSSEVQFLQFGKGASGRQITRESHYGLADFRKVKVI
jgi:hypothetical protein